MTKSKQRTTLEKLLASAKTRAEKADIASRLGKLAEIEGKERARKRRANKSKQAEAAKVPAPKPDDGDEPFEPSPRSTTKPLPPSPAAIAHRRQVRADLRATGETIPWDHAIDGDPPPPPETPSAKVVREADAKQTAQAASSTRTISAFALPIPQWNPRTERYEDEYDPRSSVGMNGGAWIPIEDDSVESDSFTNADGWASEAKAKDEAERDELWQDYLDKIAGK